TNSLQKMPGIGDIPVLGLLFRSKAAQKSQTELVFMVTPSTIRRGQRGVSEGRPSLVEPYMGGPKKPLPNPAPYVGSPEYPPTGSAPKRSENEAPAASAPRNAAAPAAVVQPG